MRVLGIAAGLIFGVPMLITLCLQVYAGIVVAGVASDVNTAMKEAEDAGKNPPAGVYKVGNIKAERTLWPGYQALTSISEPVRQRVVAFNAYVSVRDLLKKGEEMPADDLADVFMSARANTYAEAECALVLKKLASQCSVDNVSAYKVRNETGVYNISGRLRFVQKEGLGKVDTAAQLAYREIQANFGHGKRSVTVMADEAAAAREDFYAEAARACAGLRRTEGNCAIYRVTVRSNPKRGSDAMELSGNVRLSYLDEVGS
jgi:hypothetical protein